MKTLGIFNSDRIHEHPELLGQLEREYQVKIAECDKNNPPAILAFCRSVEVLLMGRGSPRLPIELAEDFGQLKYACYLAGSIKHLIPKRLISAGLIVTNWGDNISGVAEGAMTLLLAQLKQVVTLNAFSKGHPDQRIHQLFPTTLKERNVGLYGFGPIGRHMARMLHPFEPHIAIFDPYAKDVPPHIRQCPSLHELFSTCQIISIHCGLNDQTRNSVNREMLELLPQGGIVINTARGDIVDEQALADLVGQGKLLAGIDVIRNERGWNWAGSPLAIHPGAILTMHHIGSGKGYPPGHRPPLRLPGFALANLEAWRLGNPLTGVVTADIYDLKT